MGCCEGRENNVSQGDGSGLVGASAIKEWEFTIGGNSFLLRGESITYHFESFLPIGTYPVRVDSTGLCEVRKNGQTIHKKEGGGVILLQSNGMSSIFNALT